MGGWLPGHSYQGNGARGHSTKASEKADRPQKIGDGGASGRSRRRATAALPRKVVAPGAADPCPLPRTVTPPDNPRCAPPPSCRGYRFLLHGEGSRERLRQMWRIASSPEVPRGPLVSRSAGCPSSFLEVDSHSQESKQTGGCSGRATRQCLLGLCADSKHGREKDKADRISNQAVRHMSHSIGCEKGGLDVCGWRAKRTRAVSLAVFHRGSGLR